MRMSLPTIARGDGATLFEVGGPASGGQFVLFLYIDFAIKKRDVHGFIALLMDLPSIAALKAIVNDFINAIEKQPSHHVG
jgi:chemotaxis protein CheC